MSRKILRQQTNARMSQVVISNGFAFLSGQIPDASFSSITDQTTNVLTRIENLLSSINIDKFAIVSANIWLSDHKYFDEFNNTWDKWVPDGHAPARACVQAQLMKPGCDVEVAVIAVMPAGDFVT